MSSDSTTTPDAIQVGQQSREAPSESFISRFFYELITLLLISATFPNSILH